MYRTSANDKNNGHPTDIYCVSNHSSTLTVGPVSEIHETPEAPKALTKKPRSFNSLPTHIKLICMCGSALIHLIVLYILKILS